MARNHRAMTAVMPGPNVSGTRTGLALCVAISVVVHVIALVASPKSSIATSGVVASGRDRVVLSASLTVPQVPTVPPMVIQSNEAQPAKTPMPPAREVAAQAAFAAAAQAPVAASSWPDDEIERLVPRTSEGNAALSDYFLPQDLTEHPRIALDIDTSDPLSGSNDAQGGIHKAKLRLLINQQGTVDAVIPETWDMPPEMLTAIIARFHGAKFVPGSILGLPVNSQLLAEVVVGPPPPIRLTSIAPVAAGGLIFN